MPTPKYPRMQYAELADSGPDHLVLFCLRSRRSRGIGLVQRHSLILDILDDAGTGGHLIAYDDGIALGNTGKIAGATGLERHAKMILQVIADAHEVHAIALA